MNTLKVGDKIPKFECLDDKGNTVKSENLKGNKLVVFFYPRAISPFPGSVNMDFDWVESSGKGTVWTYSVHYMGPTKAYKGETYVVALIELDDGVKMMSNVVDCDPESVTIGMEVEVVFEDATDEVTFAKFKPVQ